MLLTIIITVFIIMLVPIYWKKYGVLNFLWFSDIGLFLTAIALWLHSPLLISMACIGILPFEFIWVADYFYRIVSGRKLIGMTDYMFDPKYSLFLRGLSLFHLALPPIWIYFLLHWGYDERAFVYQLILYCLVLCLCYLLTNPNENVNFVFSPQKFGWKRIPSFAWLAFMLIVFPICIFLPLHFLFSQLWGQA